jgi:hypothetical protein
LTKLGFIRKFRPKRFSSNLPQFAIDRATDAGSLLGLTKDFLLSTGWANNTLWVNLECFKGLVPICQMTGEIFQRPVATKKIFVAR